MTSSALTGIIDFYYEPSRDEYNRLYQPNFTRTRQTFRGTRDSQKVNLEIQQLFYDLYSIYAKLKESTDDQDDFYNFLEIGFDQTLGSSVWPDHEDDIYHYNQALDDYSILLVDSMYNLLCDVSVYMKKTKYLLNLIRDINYNLEQ